MPATHQVNINDHQDDPYLRDWFHGFHAQGVQSDLERANTAVMQADLYRTIASERGDDLDKAQAEAIAERAALAASACAKADRIGEADMAKRFADTAVSEVLILSTLDYVNVN